jgi:hypothetical protein
VSAKGTAVEQPEPVLLSTEQVCEVAGASFRMVDYWARVGYLHAEPRPRNAGTRNTGSGVPRRWSPDEARVARLMTLMVKAGMLPVLAHDIARNAADGVAFTIADGIEVTVHG